MRCATSQFGCGKAIQLGISIRVGKDVASQDCVSAPGEARDNAGALARLNVNWNGSREIFIFIDEVVRLQNKSLQIYGVVVMLERGVKVRFQR